MRWCTVEIEVALLHVLPVIAFVTRKAEQPLLQDGVAFIPKGDSKANELMAIADPSETVLISAVGSGAGVIVWKIFPGVAVRAVVLADCSPGSLTQIRAPAFPVLLTRCGLGKSDSLL